MLARLASTAFQRLYLVEVTDCVGFGMQGESASMAGGSGFEKGLVCSGVKRAVLADPDSMAGRAAFGARSPVRRI